MFVIYYGGIFRNPHLLMTNVSVVHLDAAVYSVGIDFAVKLFGLGMLRIDWYCGDLSRTLTLVSR
jgi:hypothetical protein